MRNVLIYATYVVVTISALTFTALILGMMAKKKSPGGTAPSPTSGWRDGLLHPRFVIGLVVFAAIFSIMWFGDFSGLEFGEWIAFIIFVGAVYGLLCYIYEEEAGGKTKKFFANKVIMATALIVVFNAAIQLKGKPLWHWLYEDVVFFVIFNSLIMISVFLAVKTKEVTEGTTTKREPDPADWKWVAVVVLGAAGLVVLRFVDTGEQVTRIESLSRGRLEGPTSMKRTDVLQVVAKCESGDRQFGEDGKPVRNPKNPKAVGRWQINLNDPAIAKLVKEKGWDVEKSEVDNKAAAEYLYEKYGLGPWTATKPCWAPQLMIATEVQQPLLGKVLATHGARDYEQIITAPPKNNNDNWSEPARVKPGYLSSGVSTKPYRVRYDREVVLVYDPEKKKCFTSEAEEEVPCHSKPTGILEYQSMSERPLEITVMFLVAK